MFMLLVIGYLFFSSMICGKDLKSNSSKTSWITIYCERLSYGSQTGDQKSQFCSNLVRTKMRAFDGDVLVSLFLSEFCLINNVFFLAIHFVVVVMFTFTSEQLIEY